MEHRAFLATHERTYSSSQRPYDELYRDLVSAVMDQGMVGMAVIFSTDLRISFANDAFWQTLARNPDGARPLPELLPGGEACGLFHHIRQSHLSSSAAHHEYRIEGLARGPRIWKATITPLQRPVDGRAVTLLQVVDVTDVNHLRHDRDRLHSLAEQRAEQFAIAIESIDNGIIVVDKKGRVRRINSVGITLLDLDDRDNAIVDSTTKAPSRVQIDLPPLHLALRGQSVRDYEHCITRRDGQKTWLTVSSYPLYDHHSTIYGAVAVFQDVSERRHLDQIKEDFLSVTAHELRTPVTALLGYTNLLVRRAEHGDWNDRDLHALRMIETQVQRLTQLINGLVDVSRVQAGALDIHPQPVELNVLVQQAAALIRAKAPDHLITVEPSPEPVVVPGDPQRLDQIVSHLIENALKFSPWGGTVTVRIWADDEAHLSVADGGIGIPEEALPQLFQRFYRAANVDPERISGLGVGLYLVKELVVAHGGSIDVQSAPEQGTTFRITLPLQPTLDV